MKFLLFFLFSLQVQAKTTIVAVIDTGFGLNNRDYEARLCKYGHKDFTSANVYYTKSGTVDKVPLDRHGHGTHIAGLIDKYAKEGKQNYCLVIIKYFDGFQKEDSNVDTTVKAIQYAKNIHADYINYSGGGIEENATESELVKSYIDQGGIFVAAAGNNGEFLSRLGYYPAMDDDRVIAVGNIDPNGNTHKTSNRGDRVNCWEMGTNVIVYDMSMTGTSQATAISTGKLVAGKLCGQKITVDKEY